MYLVSKYDWLSHPRLAESNLRSYFGEKPDLKDIVDDANRWLLELFSNRPYSRESLSIFRQRPNLMKDFLFYELFSENGVIKLKFPDGLTDAECKKYEFVTACWLVYMDSLKKRVNYESNLQEYVFEFFEDDYLIDVVKWFVKSSFPNNEPWVGIFLDNSTYTVRDITNLVKTVMDCIKKTSFVFKYPLDNNNLMYDSRTINGGAYVADMTGCIQVEISVPFEDPKIDSYQNYIRYLLERKRNGIGDFKSSRIFWKDVVQLRRRNENLETNAQSKTVLLLFILALGLGSYEYSKLIELRNKACNNGLRMVRAKLPPINDDVEKLVVEKLENMLRNSQWRLLKARQQFLENMRGYNESEILEQMKIALPRRILFNANRELLNDEQHTYPPIIELSAEEFEEIKQSGSRIVLNRLNRFYQVGQNGRRIFI